MNLAVEHAKRSACFRLNVGCLIASGKDIVGLTHNGPPRGEPHCTGHLCPGATTSCVNSRHAEENGLEFLSYPPRTLDLFVTHSPCKRCMTLILTKGGGMVKRVFFQTEFRESGHLMEMVNQHIDVYKITPAGYITTFPHGILVDPETLYT